MTGLTVSQLQLMSTHLGIPDRLRDQRTRRCFVGEGAFLHCMAYTSLEIIKLQISLYFFE